MKAKKLKQLINLLDDDVDINVSDKAVIAYDNAIDEQDIDARWWDIRGLYINSTKQINEFGQVNLLLSKKPVME